LKLIDAGFKAVITVVDITRIDERSRGMTLTYDAIAEIAACGVDACGKKSEYHSFLKQEHCYAICATLLMLFWQHLVAIFSIICYAFSASIFLVHFDYIMEV